MVDHAAGDPAEPGRICQGGRPGRPCRNPAKAYDLVRRRIGDNDDRLRPLCGIHLNQVQRDRDRAAAEAAARQAAVERRQREAYAMNLASLLSDQLGVRLSTRDEDIVLNLDDARAMHQAGVRLSVNGTGLLTWRAR